MSPAFISGVTENLSEAEITFDRFHVIKLIGEAVDEVRRGEVKTRPELKDTRYVWAKNQPNLTTKQADVLATLSATNLERNSIPEDADLAGYNPFHPQWDGRQVR